MILTKVITNEVTRNTSFIWVEANGLTSGVTNRGVPWECSYSFWGVMGYLDVLIVLR